MVYLPECAQVFHSGGARLILCGKHLDKLEDLCDALNSAADPTAVRLLYILKQLYKGIKRDT